MKILLDECVDQKLRFLFSEHDCQTAAYAKLAGLKNGVLLSAAEAAGFEVLITTDQEIPYQQNLDGRRISILILSALTNRLTDLKRLAPAALLSLNSLRRTCARVSVMWRPANWSRFNFCSATSAFR